MKLLCNRMWSTFLALHLALLPFVTGDCYSHDGILALDSKFYTGPELVSCAHETNNCCLEGEKCGSNLLCVSPDGTQSRQYCADRSWSGCSILCSEYAEAGVELTDCGDNIFCCGAGNETCCTDRMGWFVHPDTGYVQAASDGSSTTASATFWSIDTSSVIQRTTTIKPSSTRSSSSPQPSSNTITETTLSNLLPTTNSSSSAITSTGVPSAQPPPTTSQRQSSDKLSAGAGAGIGIGCAVAIAGIMALAWLFLRERRKRRQLQAGSGHRGSSHNQYITAEYGARYAAAYEIPTDQPEIGGHRSEIDGRSRYELEDSLRHELAQE